MEKPKLGVLFGTDHSLKTWGLTWTNYSISEPVPITNYVNIPGRKTRLDATNILGSTTFENRTLVFEFWEETDWQGWMLKSSLIRRNISNSKLLIILDTEPDKYWRGRATVASTMSADNPRMAFYTITCDVEPYKYLRDAPDDENWLWDMFNFETGFIQDNVLKNVTVTSTTTATEVSVRRYGPIPLWPTISVIQTSSPAEDMVVTIMGKTYNLGKTGSTELKGLSLPIGITKFYFKGKGRVTIVLNGETL